MKNIFLKETDKPSYLFIIDKSKMFVPEAPYLSYSTVGGRVHKTEGSDIYRPQFIYITNEETIKEGDWCMFLGLSMTHFKVTEVDGNKLYCGSREYFNINMCKKVVMTNDTYLIEDGVQQVSSSFLSFYAENTPNYVEVDDYIERVGWESDENGRDMILNKRFYSLNFPPKEIKTEENIIGNWLEKYGNPEIMRQVEREAEELELQHYAKKYYNNFDKRKEEFAFIDGARWQKSRMYSEEDMRLAFEVGRNFQLTGENNFNEILKK